MKKLTKTLSFFLTIISILATLNIIYINPKAYATTLIQNGDVLEITFSPRSTFLKADSYIDGVRPLYGGRSPESPALIDLKTYGFLEGDTIMISVDNAEIDRDAYWQSSSTPPNLEHNQADSKTLINAIFSVTDELFGINVQKRVPDAISYGENYQTVKTYFEGQETDIPEDFLVSPYTGKVVQIPNNANWLFLGFVDAFYPDNVGSIKVSIEKDSDGDGLIDSWEIDGIDYDKDGEIDFDLPILQADWQHKDIFVEIDYMGHSGIHWHRPNEDAINDVVQAFADSFVSNPDEINGINLHVFIDDSDLLPHVDNISWQGFDQIKEEYFGTITERNNPLTIEAKKQAFHYCVFGHSQGATDSSGSGERPGNDFMVTLGNWTNSVGSRDEQAGTFMHELGHNLGLKHGGNEFINYKPNYLSVMNYLFQTDDFNIGRPLDFSNGVSFDLNEASLNENEGIGSLDKTIWVSPNGSICTNAGNYAIDWNIDGNLTNSVQVNLNNHISLGYNSPPGENLTDYDDWGNLVYRFRGSLGFADGVHPELPDEELDFETAKLMRSQADNIIEPGIIPEFSGWKIMFLLMFLTGSIIFLRKKRVKF